MYELDTEMETLHLYIVREKPKQPYTLLPLLGALLCLLVIAGMTLYSGQHPHYEHRRVILPAQFLPLQALSIEVPIIPTGIKTTPATTAEGLLTLANGSVLSEVLPQGSIFRSITGVEVQTEQSVFIPPGSATGYGSATVLAQALVAGKQGNIASMAINGVYGTSLFIRNLTPFHGGRDAATIPIQLPQDRQLALIVARAMLSPQKARSQAFLAFPCQERVGIQPSTVRLFMSCQFVAYPHFKEGKITDVRLIGKNLVVDILSVAPPLIARMR